MRWEHFRSCVNDSLLLKTIQTILRTEPAAWINPTILHIQSSNGLTDITIWPTLWPGTFTHQLPIQLSVCGEQQNTRQNWSPPPQDSQQLLLMCQMRFPRPSVSLRLEAALTSADAFRFEAKVSSGRFKRVPSHVKPYGILTQWNHTAAGQIVGLFISLVLLRLNTVFKRDGNKVSPDGWRASLSSTIGSSTERSCDPLTTERQTSDTHTRVCRSSHDAKEKNRMNLCKLLTETRIIQPDHCCLW